MTLTLTLKLKIAFSTLLPPGAYCSVSQTPLDFLCLLQSLETMPSTIENKAIHTVNVGAQKFGDGPIQKGLVGCIQVNMMEIIFHQRYLSVPFEISPELS